MSARQAFSPSQVSGTLTAMLSAISASRVPSAIIASASVAVTSALTGPDTTSHISFTVSMKSPPALCTSEGFVVTPSSSPVAARSRMSSRSAVSAKNFIGGVLAAGSDPGGRP